MKYLLTLGANSIREAKPQGRLWVFNPGHEAGLRFERSKAYTPPRVVWRMMYDLYPLMGLLAQAGDYIGVPSMDGAGLLLFDDLGQPTSRPHQPLSLSLWGLEPHMHDHIARLARAQGIELILPKISERYVRLSHRATAVELFDALADPLELPEALRPEWFYFGCYADEGDALRRYLTSYTGQRIVIKRPYSSSGRGVQVLDMPLGVEHIEALKHEGEARQPFSLEPYWPVLGNWATLFEALPDGVVRYVGLSHFWTEGVDGTTYVGNELKEQDELWADLANALNPRWELTSVVELQRQWLEQAIGGEYMGYIGIDMLVYRDAQGLNALHPALEINMRCTMGVIALKAYETYVPKGERWAFRVEPIKRSLDVPCSSKVRYLAEGAHFQAFIHPID